MLHPSSDLFKFYDSELAAAAASFSISPVPQGGVDLLVKWYLRSTAAVFVRELQLRFNGDSGANYIWQYNLHSSTGAHTNASGYGPEVQIDPGRCPGGSSPASAFGVGELLICNYNKAVAHKATLSRFSQVVAYSAGNTMWGEGVGWWQNTAAITSLLLSSIAGSTFAIGSRVSAYVVL